jgi:hypothetical protein
MLANNTLDRKDSLPDSLQSWATWEIPEFQDMQRFVGGSRSTDHYGPLACVVAAPHLENVTDAAFDNVAGVVVAVAWVRFDDREVNAAYRRLHIDNLEHRFYCVIVRHVSAGGRGGGRGGARLTSMLTRNLARAGGTSAANAGWEGYVVPSVDKHCAITADQVPLPGSRMISTDMQGSLIPPVARFMIDTAWRPAIGARCGSGWCTVGFDARTHLEPAHGYGASGTDAQVSRRAVPGWFDDQQVGIPDEAGNPPNRPSIQASVVPDTALDRYTIASFDSTWKPVATVHFRQAPTGQYVSKWQFKAGGSVGNLIELGRVDSSGTQVWRVRINGVLNPNLKVTQTEHTIPGFHIVGTARWAWSDYDEKIWVRCDEGCCKVEPI